MVAHTPEGPRKAPAYSLQSLVASRLRFPLLLLGFALVYGTAGFIVLESYGFLDSLYMTVTTLTTVGFGEIQPLGPGGRAFTISLIVVGVVAVFGLIAEVTTLVAGGSLNRLLERRAMQRRIADLDGHYVICAYGRVGRAAARELADEGESVVVVEGQAELEPLLADSGLPYLIGDPTQESVLLEAGVARARALLCAVDSDAINVYITLTGRSLKPDLFIISRASSPESVDRLTRAGSDRVVSPYTVSGARMAAMALRPAMLEFIDMVSVQNELRIEELLVGDHSAIGGRTVRDVCSPYEGVMVLAIRRRAGDMVVPPGASTVVERGDLLIALGGVEPLARLAKEAG